MSDQNDFKQSFLSTSEKILGATKKGLHTATFKANQYKKIVQKKIDLNAVQKKISTSHADLGKLIDDLREEGAKGIMANPKVKEMFSQIDTLKQSAVDILAEIDSLKNEEEVREAPSPVQPDKDPTENDTED